MTLPPISGALRVLSELEDAGLMKHFDYEDLTTEQKVMHAWNKAQEVEDRLRDEAGRSATAPARSRKTQKQMEPFLWEVELDADSKSLVLMKVERTSAGCRICN